MTHHQPLEDTDHTGFRRRALGAGFALAAWMGATAWARAWAGTPVATTTVQPAWPTRQRWGFQVEGRASGIPYRAESTLILTLAAGQYQAINEIRMPFLGAQLQTSEGEWSDAKGPQPLRFADHKRHERNARFEAETGQIHFPASQQRTAWVKGVQDRVSLLLALAHRCHTEASTLQAGLRWPMPVVSSSGVDSWLWVCQGLQAVDLPAGRFQAWQWERAELPPSEPELSIWISPHAGSGPVRLRMVQPNGDRADQRLKSWNTNPA